MPSKENEILKVGTLHADISPATYRTKDGSAFYKYQYVDIGGKFEIVDKHQKPVCTLQGKWTGWEFKFNKDEKELASVSKKWAGIGKEFFTSADNYVLSINENVPQDSVERQLIFAAVMVIDMVLKE